MSARMSRSIAAALFAGGVLLAGASSAGASTALATTSAPHINSAITSGSEVLVSVTNPTPPSGGSVSDVFYDNGKAIDYNQFTLGSPAVYGFPASVAPVGSTITATATICTGNPDNGTQKCSRSGMSNGVVVR